MTALLTLALVARPAIAMIGEERSSWAVAYRVHQVLQLGAGPALLLVGLILRRDHARGPAAAGPRALILGATAVVLLLQSQAAWWQMHKTEVSFRSVMPSDLQWVDHHTSGPLALLAITQNAPQFDDVDYFNKQVTQVFVPEQPILGRAIQGKRCTFRFTTTGTVSAGTGCGALPHRFLINDPSARIRFRNETRISTDKNTGRVVELDPSRPVQARSMVILPCPRRTPGYSAASPGHRPGRRAAGLRGRHDGRAVAGLRRAAERHLPRLARAGERRARGQDLHHRAGPRHDRHDDGRQGLHPAAGQAVLEQQRGDADGQVGHAERRRHGRPPAVADLVSDMYVFGYGSLVALPDAVPARLRGYRRVWGVAMDNTVATPGYKVYENPEGARPAVAVAFLDLAEDPDAVDRRRADRRTGPRRSSTPASASTSAST